MTLLMVKYSYLGNNNQFPLVSAQTLTFLSTVSHSGVPVGVTYSIILIALATMITMAMGY